VPSLFVSAVSGGLLIAYVNSRLAWIPRLVVGAYVAANIGASLWIAVRGRHWRLLPRIPAAFAIIHVCAGAGLIAGALRRIGHDSGG
jgi:hypothetical protein